MNKTPYVLTRATYDVSYDCGSSKNGKSRILRHNIQFEIRVVYVIPIISICTALEMSAFCCLTPILQLGGRMRQFKEGSATEDYLLK